MPGSIYDRHRDLFLDSVRFFRDADGEVMRIPELGLQIWGRPHVSYDDYSPVRPGPGWHDDPALAWKVAVAHGIYYESHNDAYRSYLIHDDDIASLDAHYIALGHLERHHQVGPEGTLADYSGAPERSGGVTMIELTEAGTDVQHLKFELE